MSISTVEYESSILERLIASDVTPEGATFILSLKFSGDDEERMHELAEKARQGTLTPDEQAEADGFERVGALIGILKSKARMALKPLNDADQSEPS